MIKDKNLFVLKGEIKDQPIAETGDREIYLDYNREEFEAVLDKICDIVNEKFPKDEDRYKVTIAITIDKEKEKEDNDFKKYPCGRMVLSCGNRDTRECSDARYAIRHWGGGCSFYDYDESIEEDNRGKVEDDFTYED